MQFFSKSSVFPPIFFFEQLERSFLLNTTDGVALCKII